VWFLDAHGSCKCLVGTQGYPFPTTSYAYACAGTRAPQLRSPLLSRGPPRAPVLIEGGEDDREKEDQEIKEIPRRGEVRALARDAYSPDTKARGADNGFECEESYERPLEDDKDLCTRCTVVVRGGAWRCVAVRGGAWWCVVVRGGAVRGGVWCCVVVRQKHAFSMQRSCTQHAHPLERVIRVVPRPFERELQRRQQDDNKYHRLEVLVAHRAPTA
jgi:hypothetical protein